MRERAWEAANVKLEAVEETGDETFPLSSETLLGAGNNGNVSSPVPA
jgi:hypothetical protein